MAPGWTGLCGGAAALHALYLIYSSLTFAVLAGQACWGNGWVVCKEQALWQGLILRGGHSVIETIHRVAIAFLEGFSQRQHRQSASFRYGGGRHRALQSELFTLPPAFPPGRRFLRRKGGADFPLDRFLALCREAKAWGIRKVFLIGEGEPLLHPGLLEMVAAAKAAGCQVELLTNGTLLNAQFADEFIKAGLDALRVSLWAANEEQYRVLNPGTRPEMFHRALEGVRSVAAARRERRSPGPG